MTAFRVVNLRKGPFGAVNAFFNIAFGYEGDGEFTGQFVVKDFALKSKKDGGYWIQGPSKQRIKDGQPVVGADGYNVYDEYFDLYLEKKGEKSTPTEAAWAFKKALLAAVTEAYETAGESNAGRGATSKPKRAAATPAAATTSKIKETLPPAIEDDGDDDLPF